jgi:hypothetical protein
LAPERIACSASLTCTTPTTVSIEPRTTGIREYLDSTNRSNSSVSDDATSIQATSVRGVMTSRTRVSPKSTIDIRSFSSSFSRMPSWRPTSM